MGMTGEDSRIQRNAEETGDGPARMDAFETLRRPEYTGQNRCWPCTAVNVLLLAVLALAVSFANPVVGLGILVAGGLGILLRGYVIPYTPEFAPRLVALVPGAERLFPTHPDERRAGGIGDEDAAGEDVVSVLFDAGVLVGAEELSLASDLHLDWHATIDELQTTTEDLATAVEDASPEPVRTRIFEEDGRAWIIVTDENESLASETWLSRPVAIADVAAVRVLTDRGIEPTTAANAAAPLRLFLDECPDCGGELIETTGDGCCGGFGPGGPTHVLACEDCRQRLATLD